MSRETVLTNARLVLPESVTTGTVVLRDGLIAAISEGSVRHGDDLGGDYLLPGLVELHTDHFESHFEPRPGTFWDPVPAILAHDIQLNGAGATTLFDAVRVGAMEGSGDLAALGRSLIEAIREADAAGLTRSQHFIHLRCEVAAPSAADEFEQLTDGTGVRLASLMDHTPGQRQYADVSGFRRYVLGKGLVREQDLEAHMATLRAIGAEHSGPNRRAIAQLAATRAITLAAHDDATVEHVAEAQAFGVRISEFPTTETAARAAHYSGQLVIMGAPNIVRGGSQSGNVAATALVELGLLDALSSDYVPASPLQALFMLHTSGALPLEQGAKLVSRNPARSVGLEDRGEIAVGQRADLVRVTTHALAGSTPLRRCLPVVRAVYRQGERVS